jgi:tetratricopeptide (TPR) repeat protein
VKRRIAARTAPVFLLLALLAAAGGPAAADGGEAPGEAVAEAEGLLAAGRYDEAIASFERLRAAWPDDGRILHGLARSLAGKRRYRAADEVYRDMEERRIDPVMAHLERAHLWVKRGDLVSAERAYRNVMQAEGGNLEARIGLARVKHLQGLDRAALDQARNIVLDHPENEEARLLLADIEAALRPTLDIEPIRFDDGSGGRVDSLGAAFTFMADPQTSIRLSADALDASFLCADPALCDSLAGPGRTGERLAVDAYALEAGVDSRLIASIDFHARLGAALQEDLIGGERTVLIAGGIIRWRVGPRFTILATGQRGVLSDTAELIARGMRLDAVDMLLEFRFRPAWRLRGKGEYGSYSDGNVRWTTGAGVQWSPGLRGVDFSGAFDVWYRRYQDDRDNGYFDPRRYDSERLTFEAAGEIPNGRLDWSVRGMIGRQAFDTGVASRLMAEATDTVYAARAAAGVALGSRGRLEAFWSAGNDPLEHAIAFDGRRYGLLGRLRM